MPWRKDQLTTNPDRVRGLRLFLSDPHQQIMDPLVEVLTMRKVSCVQLLGKVAPAGLSFHEKVVPFTREVLLEIFVASWKVHPNYSRVERSFVQR